MSPRKTARFVAGSGPRSPFAEERAVYFQRDIFTTSHIPVSLFASYRFSRLSEHSRVEDAFERLVARQADRVVFSNPYRSPDIQGMYEYCRAQRFPILVVERGCFPDTTFMDTGGFLLDSPFYRADYWDKPLSGEHRAALEAYCEAYHSGTFAPLERQPARTHGAQQRSSAKRKIFITLQMPQDTVVRFFAAPAGGYPQFVAFWEDIVARYAKECEFYYKPHPNAPDLRIAGAKDLSHTHIDQAISDCDGLVTFNSGTGVLGFLHRKPVATFGKAFYDAPGVTSKVRSPSEFADFLSAGTSAFDPEKRDRLLAHLLFRVLSNVRFRRYPLLKTRRTAFIRYDVARIFNEDTAWEQRCSIAGSRALDDGVSLLRAAWRWGLNRVYR